MVCRHALFVFFLFGFIQKSEAVRYGNLSTADSVPVVNGVFGKNADSAKAKTIQVSSQRWNAPKKAALLSAVVPGAGQIYNKKGVWWKLPLYYGAYGYSVYNHLQARRIYFFYKDIYELRVKNQPLPATLYRYKVPESYNTTDVSAFFRQKNNYRNGYERSFLWMGAAHLFAVADAFVTAHLKSFDVSDNLSMLVKPTMNPISMCPGLGVCFQVK